MGCCCSFLSGEDGGRTKESELVAQGTGKALFVSARMTAPTVSILDDGICVKGSGLALVGGSAIEQDAAYWEWQIELPSKQQCDTIMFGVCTKKDRKFYTESEDKENNSEPFMRSIECQNGDVVGVATQQSDLPMIQFTHNGEIMHDKAVNRFRGTVYPSIYLPFPADENLKVRALLEENEFQHITPAAKFGPIIIARNIV